MDEEFDTSVDTSDVDTSADMDALDVVDDVPDDIPDDIPEDVPEDEPELAEENDLSDDIPEDVPEDEPELTEDNNLSEDTPEDVPEDEPELTEEDDLSEDIPEDVLEEQEVEDTTTDEAAEDTTSDVDSDDSTEPAEDTQDEPLDDATTDEATEDTTSDVDSGDSTEPAEDTQDEPLDNTTTDEATEDTTSDVDNSDSTEPIEDTQDEPLDDATTDEATEDTTSDVDSGDSTEPVEDTQNEPLDDTTTDEATEDTTSDVDNSDSTEPIEDTQDEPLDDTTTEETVEDTTSNVDSGNTDRLIDTQQKSSDDTNEFNGGIQDAPSKVLKRDELDLFKSGNDAINQRLEAQADDYRDKGMSEDEIRDRLAADKWNFQKEFLEDAFPGQDISPNVFNGLSENGSKDRIADIKQSEALRNILDSNEQFGRDLTLESMENYSENQGLVNKADFHDFDPDVAKEVVDSLIDAKRDFPELEVNYIGSIDSQVNGLRDTIEQSQFEYYKQNGIDEGLASQMAKADAMNYTQDLTPSRDTFAWSLRTNNSSLGQFDGVAVNNVTNDCADNYSHFKDAMTKDVLRKGSPVGCGSPKACLDHELGHEIDNLLGASNDTTLNNMYSDMMKNNNAKDVLSAYSAKNVKEFIAEAYAEYRNNPKPRPTSVAVYNRLIQLRDLKSAGRS